MTLYYKISDLSTMEPKELERLEKLIKQYNLPDGFQRISEFPNENTEIFRGALYDEADGTNMVVCFRCGIREVFDRTIEWQRNHTPIFPWIDRHKCLPKGLKISKINEFPII